MEGLFYPLYRQMEREYVTNTYAVFSCHLLRTVTDGSGLLVPISIKAPQNISTFRKIPEKIHISHDLFRSVGGEFQQVTVPVLPASDFGPGR